MKHACDMVPVSVVLKSWLKTDSLSPTQRAQVKDLVEKVWTAVRPAEPPFIQSACFTEREARVYGAS